MTTHEAADGKECTASDKRYHVHVEFKYGVLSCIKRTGDREEAANTCNFWDRRINSYFIDKVEEERHAAARLAAMTPLERGLAKLDALEKATLDKIAKLPLPGWTDENSVLEVVNKHRYILWQSGCDTAGNPEGYYRRLTIEDVAA